MKNIFINQQENRFKAGWRIFFFLLIFWVFAASTFIIKPLLGDITKKEFLENYSLLIVSILAIGSTIAVFLSRKFFDKKSFVSLGLSLKKQSFFDVIFGFLLSGAMAFLFCILLISFNLIEINGINFSLNNPLELNAENWGNYIKTMSLITLLIVLVEHILVGYWEELVFRGYVFQNMIEGLGLKLSIIISCIIYGLIHALNPNAGIVSTLIIVLFGYLRIYGYLSTKMLWLSIGMHIGWNFFQGPIFGFAASGHKKATLLDISINSNKDWLTGGEFGPEGSILIILIIIFALLIMKWRAKKTVTKNLKKQ
ncbi:CPBP family intramembrane glutamic endopeptidase [Tenacibaculum holothuriorum]|uniref:CPBP family intramembrane glutamic endopeptidase n=1 Tax=Tenacibaculum holothuriorum TaxID=1635173 RepID=UPI00117F5C63|nr:type II CAAX endopeptidase family protein [Tenacibaculum holothuriorum]